MICKELLHGACYSETGEFINKGESSMAGMLIRVICYVLIMCLGYILKRSGFFAPTDYRLLSKIFFNLTLPAVIITNFASTQMDFSFLALILLGFLGNLCMILIGYILSHKRETGDRAFMMFSGSGYMPGSFTLPFVQSFLPGAAALGLFMFDAGNALMCNGGSFALVNMMLRTKGFERFSAKPILKSLLTSTPFMTYLIMLVVSALRIPLPSPLLSFTGIIANANMFIGMLMIGIMFEINMSREHRRDLIRLTAARVGFSTLCALISYFVLPFPLPIRQVLVLLFFSPISTLAPIYTERTGGDAQVASAMNTITMILGVIAIPILLIMMGIS